MASLPAVRRMLYEDGTITICPANRRKGELNPIEKAERAARMQEKGRIKKGFVLDPKQKRIIKCAGIRMYHTKKNSIKWFTLTFPGEISQPDANKCLSKFVENLKTNYNANSYIIVKENTKQGRPHFHCLVDMPFKHFNILNTAWCHAFSVHFGYSRNALTSGREKIIKNLRGVMSYVLKYITKSDTKDHTTRIYFTSQNILPQPKEISYNEYIYFTTSFESRTIVKDNFTIVFLKNFAYLPEMFTINYPKKEKRPQKIPKLPDALQPNLNF